MRSYNWDGAQLYVHMYFKFDIFQMVKNGVIDLWARSNN